MLPIRNDIWTNTAQSVEILPAGWRREGESLLYNSSGTPPAIYTVGIRGSFYGTNRPNREAHSSPGFFQGLECMEPYPHAFLLLNGVIFKYRISFTFISTSWGQFK
jgi:hypothetical protein